VAGFLMKSFPTAAAQKLESLFQTKQNKKKFWKGVDV
jgi:hypothetical protein